MIKLLVLVLVTSVYCNIQYTYDSSTWTLSGAVPTTQYCGEGADTGFSTFYFNSTGPRYMRVPPQTYIGGGIISWRLWLANATSCGTPVSSNPVYFEYRPDSTMSWSTLLTFTSEAYGSLPFNIQSVPIPLDARTPTAEFQWIQLGNDTTGGSNWAIADILFDLSVVVQPVSDDVFFYDDFTGDGTGLLPTKWDITPETDRILPTRNIEMTDERDLDLYPNCTSNADCVGHQFCNTTYSAQNRTNRCANKFAAGDKCTSGSHCQSGICVEGYCCIESCAGPCRSCVVEGYRGICVSLAAGTSDSGCDQTTGGCAMTGKCDGYGGCAQPETCTAEVCSGSTYTPPTKCVLGNTTCPDAAAAVTCDSISCQYSSSMSASCFTSLGLVGTACDSDENCTDINAPFCRQDVAVCVPRLENGQTCEENSDCDSSFCVSGVCCDAACDTECLKCTVPGFVGQCIDSPNNTFHSMCTKQSPCGRTGVCSSGYCQLWPNTTVCSRQECSPTSYKEAQTCAGDKCGDPTGFNVRDRACVIYEGQVLCFTGVGHRYAVTVPLDVSDGGFIRFMLRRDISAVGSISEVKLGSDLRLLYSIDTGLLWHQMGYYHTYKRFIDGWRFVEEIIPVEAYSSSTIFKLEQLAPLAQEGQKWAVDNFAVVANAGPSPGKAGLALDLSRIDLNTKVKGQNYITYDTSSSPAAFNMTAITVEMWVYLSEISDVLMRKMSGSGTDAYSKKPDWALGIGAGEGQLAGRSLQFSVTHTDKKFTKIYSTASLSFDRWTHIAVTYNGSDTGYAMYLDGEALDFGIAVGVTDSDPSTSTGINYTNGTLVLGTLPDDGTIGFYGRIDDVRVWNRVRTVDEIRSNLKRPANSWTNESLTDCILFWSFDVASQNGQHIASVVDITGHSHTGVLSSTRILVPSQIGVEQSYMFNDAHAQEVLIELDGQCSGTLGTCSIDEATITEFPISGEVYAAVIDTIVNTTTPVKFTYKRSTTVIKPGDVVTKADPREDCPLVYFLPTTPGRFTLSYKVSSGALNSATDAVVVVDAVFPAPNSNVEEPPPMSTEETAVVAAVGSVGGFLVLAGAGSFFYYKKWIKENRVPESLCPIFDQEIAYAEKYWQTAYDEAYLNTLGAVEDLLMDMRTVVALTKATQITEADELCKSLVYIYEHNNRCVDMLKVFIIKEIRTASTDRTLFRGDSVASKLLKAYSKMIGLEYLHVTLSAVLNEYIFKCHKQKDESSGFEVDSQRTDGDEMSSDANKYALMQLAQKVLGNILKSAKHAPIEFRIICNTLFGEVKSRWPQHAHKSVGGFIFLRFFIPAVVAPHSYGLVYTQPNDSAQRMLTLLGKILLNCANDVEFGQKEAYMIKMNDFIHQNRDDVRHFFEVMSQLPDDYYEDALGVEEVSSVLPNGVYPMALVNVHRKLDMYQYKVQTFLSDQTLSAADLANGVEPGAPEKATESLRNGLAMALKMLQKPPALPKVVKKTDKALPLLWYKTSVLAEQHKSYSTVGLGYVVGSGYETALGGDLEPSMTVTKKKAVAYTTVDPNESAVPLTLGTEEMTLEESGIDETIE